MLFRMLRYLHISCKPVNQWLVGTVVRTNYTHFQEAEVLSTIVRHGAVQVSLLRKYLNCPFDVALNIIITNTELLFNTSNEYFEDQLTFFIKTLKFDPKIIIETPKLLCIARLTLENRILYLKDYGFDVNDVSLILNFNKHIMETSEDLISSGILKNDPTDNVLAFVEEDIAESIRNSLKTSSYLSFPLKDLHKLLLKILLSIRFECSEDEASMLMKRQPRLVIRSLTSLNQMLLLLIDKLQFSKSILLSRSYILGSCPTNVFRCLERPLIGSKDTVQRIRKEPAILLCSDENITKLDQIYKRFSITDEQLKYQYAYNVKANKVEHFLTHFDKHKELKALKAHPRFLQVVIALRRVQSNMKKFRSQGMVSWSIPKLLSTPKNIDKVLNYSSDRCRGNEAVYYLAKTLDMPRHAVREKLNQHPCHTRVSFISVQLVLDGLLDRGVSKEQVWNALPIVLYDFNMLMRTLSELETYPELAPFEEWKSSPYLLRVLLYYLEKNNSFNFTGVFLSDNVPDDDDDHHHHKLLNS